MEMYTIFAQNHSTLLTMFYSLDRREKGAVAAAALGRIEFCGKCVIVLVLSRPKICLASYPTNWYHIHITHTHILVHITHSLSRDALS